MSGRALSTVDLRGLQHVLGAAAAQAGKAAHLARALATLRELPADQRLACKVPLYAHGQPEVYAVLPVTVEEIRARLRAEVEITFVEALDGLDQARDAVEDARGTLRHAEDAA
jgi:hypothetical protein